MKSRMDHDLWVALKAMENAEDHPPGSIERAVLVEQFKTYSAIFIRNYGQVIQNILEEIKEQ